MRLRYQETVMLTLVDLSAEFAGLNVICNKATQSGTITRSTKLPRIGLMKHNVELCGQVDTEKRYFLLLLQGQFSPFAAVTVDCSIRPRYELRIINFSFCCRPGRGIVHTDRYNGNFPVELSSEP